MSEARYSATFWPNPVRSPSFLNFYSNISQTSLSPWDISLTFGFLSPTGQNSEPGVEERAMVTFSPQQFKALAAAFTNTLAAYEKRFGQINLDPNLVQSVEALTQAMEEVDRSRSPNPPA